MDYNRSFWPSLGRTSCFTSDANELSRCVWVGSCRQSRVNADDSQLNTARRKSMENMELVKLTPDKVTISVLCSLYAQI